MRSTKRPRWLTVAIVCLFVFLFTTVVMSVSAEGDPVADVTPSSDSVFTALNSDGEETQFDLTDGDSALEYVDAYAKNRNTDPSFKAHIDQAVAKIRETVPHYASVWALVAPVIAIVLALITKEVYSSLFVGILAGGLIYANFNLEGTLLHVVNDGFISSLASKWNVGILIFLVMLGALVAMMNKAGGSAAFGRWATTHIKSRVGAQLATIALGVLIFVDDYFNCLTVGSVMRPVTDGQKISRAKLSYLIDATAAPVCIIAPISSWAAAVSGLTAGSSAGNSMTLFLQAIPYNFYALLTIAMLLFLAFTKTEFGPMKKHENNAKNGDLFTVETEEAVENMQGNPKGRVWDLVVPIVFLILSCVVGMIYTGGFFDATDSEHYRNFITAFADCSASSGLAYGSMVALIFAILYFSFRRVISFKKCMECVPDGFKLMVPAIMILTCAWALNEMTGSLGAKIFISQIVETSAGVLSFFLPAIIFLIAVGLSFATGTSWGTFGILIPIVLSVFGSGEMAVIGISACMAGAVCGDHCSPISDTTIMASAGAQCNHIAHVSTQLPYALLVAGVSFIGYLLCGFVQSAWVVLPICLVLLFGIILAIRAIQNKKAA